MKVLLIGDYRLPFLYRLVSLLHEEVEFGILWWKRYAEDYDEFRHKYKRLDARFHLLHDQNLHILSRMFIRNRFFKSVVLQYDVINLHAFGFGILPFVLKERCIRKIPLVVTMWGGSDLFRSEFTGRRSFIEYLLIRETYKKADIITVPSKYHAELVDRKFSIHGNYVYTVFPTDLVGRKESDIREFMREWHIPRGKIVISIGYKLHFSTNWDYENVIAAINNIPEEYRKKIIVCFPVGHAALFSYNERLLKLKEMLKKNALFEYRVIDKFLSREMLWAYRYLTDIFVLTYKLDSFSSSLQEALYAGSVVITGSWLPYREIIDRGGYMEFVHSQKPGELTQKLLYVMDNLEKLKYRAKSNRQVIAQINDLSRVRYNWLTAYSLAMKGREEK